MFSTPWGRSRSSWCHRMTPGARPLVDLLRAGGHQVVVEPGPAAAATAVAQDPLDLLVLDLHAPGTDVAALTAALTPPGVSAPPASLEAVERAHILHGAPLHPRQQAPGGPAPGHRALDPDPEGPSLRRSSAPTWSPTAARTTDAQPSEPRGDHRPPDAAAPQHVAAVGRPIVTSGRAHHHRPR